MADNLPSPLAVLNDRLRQKGVGGRIVISRGIFALPGATIGEILRAVRAFDAFDARDDPKGEHSGGVLDVGELRVRFTIEYRDRFDERYASANPADPERTERVLTVRLVKWY